jgi:magnesium-transporting ATPase (P-type)
MQNKLKGDTTSAIKVIKTAGVRPIMVTGDNALTAVSVARECTLINPELDAYLGDVVTNDRGEPFVKWTLVRQSDNPVSSSEQGGYDLPATISSVGELLLQQSESAIQPTEIAVTGRVGYSSSSLSSPPPTLTQVSFVDEGFRSFGESPLVLSTSY